MLSSNPPSLLSSILLPDSTRAARKAFLNFLGHQPHQKADEKPHFYHAVKQLPPLLSLTGILLPEQPIFADAGRGGSSIETSIDFR